MNDVETIAFALLAMERLGFSMYDMVRVNSEIKGLFLEIDGEEAISLSAGLRNKVNYHQQLKDLLNDAK